VSRVNKKGKIMVKAGIATWSFNGFTLDKAYEVISAVGAKGADIRTAEPHLDRPNRMENFEQVREAGKKAKEQIDAYGIEPLSLAMRTEGSPFDHDPSTYNLEFDKNLEFAKVIGAKSINEHYLNPLMAADLGHEEALRRLKKVWGECSKRAGEHGIKLVWEFEIGSAFRTPDHVVQVSEELASPWFGALYDTSHAHIIAGVGLEGPNGHFYEPIEGGQIELLRRLKGLIGHVHIADTVGAPDWWGALPHQYTTGHVNFGEGDVDFDAVGKEIYKAQPDLEWWTLDEYGWRGDASEVQNWMDKFTAFIKKSIEA